MQTVCLNMILKFLQKVTFQALMMQLFISAPLSCTTSDEGVGVTCVFGGETEFPLIKKRLLLLRPLVLEL